MTGPRAQRPRGGHPAADPLAARRAASALLGAVLGEGRLLGDLLDGERQLRALAPPVRAEAQRLATATLRQLARADAIIAPRLRRSPRLEVRNILRLAVVEMAVFATPPHAAVDAAVRLAREGRRSRGAAGMVNAVLRSVSAGLEALWPTLPPPRLPAHWRAPLVADWGEEAVAAIEAIQAEEPPVDLTARSPVEAPALARRLGADLLPSGSLRLRPRGAVSALPGYGEGAWWVQDAAAALPARVLAPAPGERVLDLCAAPGGKTLQLAAAGARVTAVDRSGRRLRRLGENLIRTGLSAEVVEADALAFGEPGTWPAILLDAPCTASGTIRRHPDLPHAKTGSIGPLLELQCALADRAVELLAPGGRLVLCTCSLLRAEGEEAARALLARHPRLERRAIDPVALGGSEEWGDGDGGLRTRPDFWAERGGMDGFHISLFHKPA